MKLIRLLVALWIVVGLAYSGSQSAAETGTDVLAQEDSMTSITILVEGMMKSRSGST